MMATRRLTAALALALLAGVLALDGDRDHKLLEDHALNVEIRRDGPWMLNLGTAMRWAVAQGMIRA